MSVHLTSLVWEVEFPTSTQKLLLLRVADYADDDGAGIYPSISEVARQVGASERQIQYAIRAFENACMIERVTEGGSGPKRTNVWRINVDLLAELALQEKKLEGSHDCLQAVENEGAIIAPRILARVQSRLLRVQSATAKGATHCTQTEKNQTKEQKGAQERASDDARAPAAGKPVPQFDLTPDDVSWDTWMTWLSDNDRRDVLLAAQEARRMTVIGSKWPTAKSVVPRVNHGAFIAKRKTGEAA